MSFLIQGRELSKTYGARTLFSGVDLAVAEGERIGIIGPNGAGKTTLLRILTGQEEPDEGTVHRRKGLRLAFVPQGSDLDPEARIVEVMAAAARVEQAPTAAEEVERQVRVNVVLDQVGFTDPEQLAGSLSGGWRRRLTIAAALAQDPEVLLLDEPTNHLDLETILWLERLLVQSRHATLVISHDRAFLEQVASRIIEISPRHEGGIFAAAGTYSEFIARRAEHLAAQARQAEGLANRVRRELEWLSRGPKARTSKSRSRIEEAGRLEAELAELRSRQGGAAAGIELEASGRRTKRLLVASDLVRARGGRTVLDRLDLILRPGLRLAVVGANGSGKSTLLELLAGEQEPDAGSIQTAPELRTVYFDQNRSAIEPGINLRTALSGGSDTVIYRDRPIHVAGWASRFQFRADQLELPVSELSGGELARVHIARLMLQPADLLLLDEPTNDLDIDTLEVLEESLVDFPGALVLVTHDRMLLDRVATLVLGLDGVGGATFYADAAQWLDACRLRREEQTRPARKDPPRPRPRPARKGLSYREQQEYDRIQDEILQAEATLEAAAARLEDPAVASDAEAAHTTFLTHQEASRRVDTLYERWAELEEKREPG